MAQRSTRNKIKWQAKKIQAQLDRCLIHLQSIDELAEEQSEVITKWVPPLYLSIEQMKKFVATFQSQL